MHEIWHLLGQSLFYAGKGRGIEIEMKSHQNVKPENILARVKSIQTEYF